MIKHLATASCMTLLLASCDLINPEETNSTADNTGTNTDIGQTTGSVEAGSNQTATAGVPITLSGSTVGLSNNATTSWTVNGQTKFGSNVSITFDNQGFFTAEFKAIDNGVTYTDTITINVSAAPTANEAPVASFNIDGQVLTQNNISTGTTPLAVTFTNTSTDDTQVSSSTWLVNGQQVATSVNYSNTFSAVGTYTIRLIVTDSEGLSSIKESTLVVEQTGSTTIPVINAINDVTVNTGQAFTLSGSATNAVGYSASWLIDGNTYLGNIVTVPAINTAGNYSATYQLVDSNNNTVSKTINVTVLESNVAPVVNAGANINAVEGESFVLSGSATDGNSGDILTYAWSITGQSNVALGATINHSIATAGTYVATLTVSDGTTSSTDTVNVTITEANVVVPAGDESYTLLHNNAQMDIYTINNCGENPSTTTGNYVVLASNSALSLGDTWNHITSTSGEWEGVKKQAYEYNIATSISGTSVECENESTYNNILVKKFGDWDHQHANGFKFNVPSSPTYANIHTVVLDLYVSSADSHLPTMAEISAAYLPTAMTQAQINEMDDGEFHLELQLTSDDAYSASADIELTRADLDKWLRIEVPVSTMNFWQEVNYNRITKTFSQMENRTVRTSAFVAETASRNVYRSYDQNNFDANTSPKLFKEEAIQMRKLEITTQPTDHNGGGNGGTTNTAPTVNIGANQSITVNTPVNINSTVTDPDTSDTLSYQWKLDGNNHSTTTYFSNTFTQTGTYSVSLSVNDGTDTTTQSITITVTDDSNGACASSGTPVQMYGDLYVEGSKIKGCDGENVQLRGMSMFWSQWSSYFYNSNVVDTLVDDWDVSVLRAAMGVDSDLDGYANPANKAMELANTEVMIDAALARGVYVIVDFHTHFAEDYKAEAITFFKDIATRYGNNPNIIYEIYNEPLNGANYNNDPNWWASTIKPYAEDVIAEIRAIDPDNLIIVGTRTWSQRVDEAANNRITGYDNIAYTIHFYADTHKQSVRDYVQYAINQGIAVFSTEWGMTHANGGTMCPGDTQNSRSDCDEADKFNDNTINIAETEAWLDFFDANDISWLNWALMDKDESSSALIPGASPTGNWSNSDLSPSGQWIKNRLNSY